MYFMFVHRNFFHIPLLGSPKSKKKLINKVTPFYLYVIYTLYVSATLKYEGLTIFVGFFTLSSYVQLPRMEDGN